MKICITYSTSLAAFLQKAIFAFEIFIFDSTTQHGWHTLDCYSSHTVSQKTKLSDRGFAFRSFLFHGKRTGDLYTSKIISSLLSWSNLFRIIYILLHTAILLWRGEWDDVMMRVCNERLHAAETANALISLINFSRENRGDQFKVFFREPWIVLRVYCVDYILLQFRNTAYASTVSNRFGFICHSILYYQKLAMSFKTEIHIVTQKQVFCLPIKQF